MFANWDSVVTQVMEFENWPFDSFTLVAWIVRSRMSRITSSCKTSTWRVSSVLKIRIVNSLDSASSMWIMIRSIISFFILVAFAAAAAAFGSNVWKAEFIGANWAVSILDTGSVYKLATAKTTLAGLEAVQLGELLW